MLRLKMNSLAPTCAQSPISRCKKHVALAAFAIAFACPTTSWAIGPLGTVKVGATPGPIAIIPSTHSVYVANQASGTVTVFNSETLAVTKTLTVGSNPEAIAANPAADTVYVANSGSGSISMIKGTATPVTWNIGGQPQLLAVDSVLNQLYVADPTAKHLEILDGTKGTVLATLNTPATIAAMTINIATHDLFVACSAGSGSVVVIDGAKKQIVTTVTSTLPAGIASITVDAVSNVVIVASPTAAEIASIDVNNNYTVTNESGTDGEQPFGCAYDPGEGLFLVADHGGNVYFALGTGNFTLGNLYQIPELGMSSIAVSPATNSFGVLFSGGGLEVVDLLTPGFSSDYHSLNTGNDPSALVFDAVTSRAFVTNAGDGTASAFDVSPRSVVPAYEGSYGQSDIDYNYIDSNPATGTVYTLRLGNLFAINEAQAGAGANGMGSDAAGVTTIPLSSIYSEAVAVNSATNKIYAGDSTGFFYSVDGTTNQATLLSSIPATASIRSIAIDSATNEILAWDYEESNVFVLDGSKETLLKTIPVPNSALGSLTVDATKNLAYFAGSSVSVIDPAAGTIVASIALPGVANYAALNPAKERLYVVTSNQIAVINTGTNAVVTTIPFSMASPTALAVNPVTGNFYLGLNEAGVPHVLVYKESTNKLIVDLSGTTFPAITGDSDIKVNPLTNTVYVGSDRGTSTSTVAAIDGNTNAVSAVLPSSFEDDAAALAVDLGSSILAGAGYSYTSLWYPTSDVGTAVPVPIAVKAQGVSDADTIATTPLFRTTNTKPSFTISASSTVAPSALIPAHAFFQVDGWLGTWTAATLKAKTGQTVSTATIKTPTLATGRHILYVYAAVGDVATIQDTYPNSPVISPIASVVFTVEK